MGIIVSLNAKKIIHYFQTEMHTIFIGLVLFLLITIALIIEDIFALFLLIFLFCLGMFTVHTVSTGLANSMLSSQKSLTAGMYLTFYYLGGAMGSYLPSLVYERFGWDVVITILCSIVVFTMTLVHKRKKLFL